MRSLPVAIAIVAATLLCSAPAAFANNIGPLGPNKVQLDEDEEDLWLSNEKAQVVLEVAALKKRGKKSAALMLIRSSLADPDDGIEDVRRIYSSIRYGKCMGKPCVLYGYGGGVIIDQDEIATPYQLAFEDPGCSVEGFSTTWRPQSELNWSEYLEKVDRVSDGNEIWGCIEFRCVTVHKLESVETESNVSAVEYAYCLVDVVNKIKGAPVYCSALVYSKNGQRYFRTISGTGTVLCSLSPSRSVMSFTLRAGTLEAATRAIRQRLETGPGQFQSQLMGDRIVVGTAAHRRSPVLNAWERSSVNVFLVPGSSSREFGVVLDISLWVNPLNTTRNQDYNSPSDVQVEAYERFLTREIREALRPLCSPATNATLDCRH